MLNKIVRWETFHTALQYLSYALAGKPYMGVGRNLSYKKTIFYRHKGFSAHNNIPSGDDDLFINMIATKTNTAIVIDKEAHTLSEPHTSWTVGWNRKTGTILRRGIISLRISFCCRCMQPCKRLFTRLLLQQPYFLTGTLQWVFSF